MESWQQLWTSFSGHWHTSWLGKSVSGWNLVLTILASGRLSVCLGDPTPSSYSAARYLLMPMLAEPQKGFLMLLHAPVMFLYWALMSHIGTAFWQASSVWGLTGTLWDPNPPGLLWPWLCPWPLSLPPSSPPLWPETKTNIDFKKSSKGQNTWCLRWISIWKASKSYFSHYSQGKSKKQNHSHCTK